MPEELDSSPEQGAPVEASEGVALGEDLFGATADTPQTASEPAPGHADADGTAVSTDTDNVPDLLRTPAEQLSPEGREAQRLAKQFQADYTRRNQDLADQQRQIAQERQQYLDAVQRLQQTPQQQQPLSYAEQLYASAEDDEQRRALEHVSSIINENMSPVLQQVNELQQQNQLLQQSLLTMQQQQQGEVTAQVRTEVSALRQKYGEDAVEPFGEALVALYGRSNPATQKPYTLEEAFLLVSGKAAQEAESLAQQESKSRASAQAAANSRSTAQSPDDTGELSQAEVLAAFKELGFE